MHPLVVLGVLIGIALLGEDETGAAAPTLAADESAPGAARPRTHVLKREIVREYRGPARRRKTTPAGSAAGTDAGKSTEPATPAGENTDAHHSTDDPDSGDRAGSALGGE